MPTLQQLNLTYPQYRNTPYWKKLKLKLITNNHKAKCWVCGNKSRLVLHHIDYKHLQKEKLGKHIYILCWDCHEKTHRRFFSLLKTPLKKKSLLRRMWYLKFKRSAIRIRPLPALYYFMRMVLVI